MPRTIAERTRRVYDTLASVYPAEHFFLSFQSASCALRHSGIRNGMRVLEVATGSGEMFRRLVKSNPDGKTFGLDLIAQYGRAYAAAALARSFPAPRRIAARSTFAICRSAMPASTR